MMNIKIKNHFIIIFNKYILSPGIRESNPLFSPINRKNYNRNDKGIAKNQQPDVTN